MRNAPLAVVTATAILVASALVPGLTSGLGAQQHAQVREGFWISGGLGYGSLELDGMTSREDGLSGNLSLGWTIGPRFLLGGGTTGWTKDVEGIRINFSTLAVMARLYPNEEGGFFVNLGLGAGQVRLSEGGVSVSESGGGGILGVGYDFRVAPVWSLSPYTNIIAYTFDDGDANVFQFGLGVTRH
jgi:hypothetical protein